MLHTASITIALAFFFLGAPAHGGVDLVAACKEKKAKATQRRLLR